MRTFEEIEVVVLRRDFPAHSLNAGDTGTVVHVYGDGIAYEVEFVEESGYTKALLTLKPDQIGPYEAVSEAAE